MIFQNTIARLNRLNWLEMRSKIQYLYKKQKEGFALSETFLNQPIKDIILLFILPIFFSFNTLNLAENQATAPKMNLSEYGFFKGNMAEQNQLTA